LWLVGDLKMIVYPSIVIVSISSYYATMNMI
jgi:hypothetical protein